MTDNILFAIIFGGFILGLSFIIFILWGIMTIYYNSKDKQMIKKMEQSKIKHPEYFEWRKNWYDFRKSAFDHERMIDRQRRKINKLTDDRQYITEEDLTNYDRNLEFERKQLKILLTVWENTYKERYNQLNEEWKEHEKEREEKGIVVWNII